MSLPHSHWLPEEKLDVLREGDSAHGWKSLDDRRLCMVCDRTFSGRQVVVTGCPDGGATALHCPTEGCAGTPREWVLPGDPLTSAEAWADWERAMEDGNQPLSNKTPNQRSNQA